jgi:HAMP domain-containing protein
LPWKKSLQGSYYGGFYDMLVICEDCAKKYNIDENRIKGKKAKFSCRACGHVIVIEKPVAKASAPDPVSTPPAAAAPAPKEKKEKKTEQPAPKTVAAKKAGPASAVKGNKGKPIGFYLLVTLIVGFLVATGTFSFIYFKYVPDIINEQIELRTEAIAKSFSGVIKTPMLLKNYLQVNKEAQRTSKLPGVAYAAVVNKKGVVIAGFFSDLDRFDKEFSQRVKKKGFPVEILAQNPLPPGAEEADTRIQVGNQIIYDEVNATPESGGEVHIGIYVSEVDRAIKQALLSPLTLALAALVLAIVFITFFLLNRLITKPLRELTNVANRISLGEMDLQVVPSGPSEMRELAVAFERMRYSIKVAMDRMNK